MKIVGLFREVSNWVRGLFIPSLEKANTATEYMQAITGNPSWAYVRKDGFDKNNIQDGKIETYLELDISNPELRNLIEMFRAIGMTGGLNNQPNTDLSKIQDMWMFFEDKRSGGNFIEVHITTHKDDTKKAWINIISDPYLCRFGLCAAAMQETYKNLQGKQTSPVLAVDKSHLTV